MVSEQGRLLSGAKLHIAQGERTEHIIKHSEVYEAQIRHIACLVFKVSI